MERLDMIGHEPLASITVALAERVEHVGVLSEHIVHLKRAAQIEVPDPFALGDGDRCEKLMADHVKTFHDEIRSVSG